MGGDPFDSAGPRGQQGQDQFAGRPRRIVAVEPGLLGEVSQGVGGGHRVSPGDRRVEVGRVDDQPIEVLCRTVARRRTRGGAPTTSPVWTWVKHTSRGRQPWPTSRRIVKAITPRVISSPWCPPREAEPSRRMAMSPCSSNFRVRAWFTAQLWLIIASSALRSVGCSRTTRPTAPRLESRRVSARRRPKSVTPAGRRRPLQQPADSEGGDPEIGIGQAARTAGPARPPGEAGRAPKTGPGRRSRSRRRCGRGGRSLARTVKSLAPTVKHSGGSRRRLLFGRLERRPQKRRTPRWKPQPSTGTGLLRPSFPRLPRVRPTRPSPYGR